VTDNGVSSDLSRHDILRNYIANRRANRELTIRDIGQVRDMILIQRHWASERSDFNTETLGK
jgi:hypothetical protein